MLTIEWGYLLNVFFSKIKIQEEEGEEEWLLPTAFFSFAFFLRTFQGPELFPNLFAQLTAQQLCFTCVHVHFFYMNAQRQMLSVACVKGMGATVATSTVQRHHMRFLSGRNATIKTGQLDFLFVLSTKMLWNKLKCLHEVHISHWPVTFYVIVFYVELNETFWLEDNILKT